MDMFVLNLVTKSMKGVLSKLFRGALKKKFGCDMDIQINSIKATNENGKIRLKADVEAETTTDEFFKLIKKAGLN